MWARGLQENWSAFAPHFKELESNAIYVEREDEFDNYGENNQRLGDVGPRSDMYVDADTVDIDEHAELNSIPITAEDF
jgi:hypothetical protein